MFHVEHFYKNKNSTFRKRNKIKRKTNYCKINWLPLWNFAALFIGYLALKDFSKCFSSKKQRFHFCKYAKIWIICFLRKRKAKQILS